MFNPETANVLPNGASILDRRKVGNVWVWFCDRGFGYQPYVTWISREDTPGATFTGHYHSRFVKAYEDFSERIRAAWLENGFGSVS